MPMRISGIETISIKHPWGPPEEGATRDWLTVRVHTEGGLTGIGRGGDAGLIHDESAPLLEGREPQRIAALAEAHDVYVAPHGAQFPEINAHLVAAVPNGLMVSTCPDSEPYHIWSRMYNPRFEVVDGQINLTDRPGLGLDLDEEFLINYAVS